MSRRTPDFLRIEGYPEVLNDAHRVVGDKDKTTPPFHTADLHSGVVGSKLVTLPGVGHGPNWEAPDRIAEEMLAIS